MRDVVIPYQKNQSGELDVCIALINKNVPHRNIHVVEAHDNARRQVPSHINQILKLRWAIENLDITDEFYLFNDDFFVLKPVTDIPYYHRGTLDEHLATRFGRGIYTKVLKATRGFLGGDALSYDVHVPFLFDKEKLYTLIQELEPKILDGTCPLIRSTYGNRFAVGGERIQDVKISSNFEGKTYLSTSEASFRRSVGKYIRSQV